MKYKLTKAAPGASFWPRRIFANKEKFRTSGCSLYNNISTSTDRWLCAGSGISGMPYSLIFSKKEIRIKLWISRISADINTLVPDWLVEHMTHFENALSLYLPQLNQLIKQIFNGHNESEIITEEANTFNTGRYRC